MKHRRLHPKIGQWVRVKFSDVGIRDGICVRHESSNSFLFIQPFGLDTQDVEYDQVVSLGKQLEAKDSGL